MIDRLKDKLKKISKKDDSKKFMTNLVVLIFIGIALVLASNRLSSPAEVVNTKKTIEEYEDTKKNSGIQLKDDLIGDYESKIEQELTEILKNIKGVEDVKIMVNLEDTAERIPAFNTTTTNENTDENDAGGGVRKVIREDLKQEVVTVGGDDLVIIKEVKPNVKGVIVVAGGAEDILVKEKLYSAVKTVLGIAGNKVEVYSSK